MLILFKILKIKEQTRAAKQVRMHISHGRYRVQQVAWTTVRSSFVLLPRNIGETLLLDDLLQLVQILQGDIALLGLQRPRLAGVRLPADPVKHLESGLQVPYNILVVECRNNKSG